MIASGMPGNQAIDSDTDQLCVVMTDGVSSIRTSAPTSFRHWRTVTRLVFKWNGRYDGLSRKAH